MTNFALNYQNIIAADGFSIAITGMSIVFTALALISTFIAILPKFLVHINKILPPEEEHRPRQAPATNEEELLAAIGFALHTHTHAKP